MKVLLLELDGKIPNHALMRISAHHNDKGDQVSLRRAHSFQAIEPQLGDSFDRIYASAIFEPTLPLLRRVQQIYPEAVIGGSALPEEEFVTLEQLGIFVRSKDYGHYPEYPHSIGYTQRGCRLNCSFCKVPWMEGKVSGDEFINEIWRGEPHPKNLLLLDNDFFGHPDWRLTISAIRDGDFKVCFNQGINARLLSDEACEAVASVRYFDDSFTARRMYTAWDSRKDEKTLFKNLNRLAKHGVKPEHIMVYMLLGYWPDETAEDREYRRVKLREFGARPYPMPFYRTKELVGFQRWVIGAYDKRISWADWSAADYRPEKLGVA